MRLYFALSAEAVGDSLHLPNPVMNLSWSCYSEICVIVSPSVKKRFHPFSCIPCWIIIKAVLSRCCEHPIITTGACDTDRLEKQPGYWASVQPRSGSHQRPEPPVLSTVQQAQWNCSAWDKLYASGDRKWREVRLLRCRDETPIVCLSNFIGFRLLALCPPLWPHISSLSSVSWRK